MSIKVQAILPRGLRSTRCISTPPPGIDPRVLFLGAYPRFSPLCRSVEEPGLAVIAVDDATGSLIGSCGIRPQLGRPVIATVGRHERCDLVLWDASVALRHLAILVEPVTSWEHGTDIHYRVFDLRTTLGIQDEQGRTLRGFRADGAAIIHCGRHTLFLLPLGDRTDWPESAGDAWDMLPERVYLDERDSVPSRRVRNASLIFRTAPLHDTIDLIAADWIANLEVEQRTRNGALAVGRAALQRGVLIGRYDRCDLPGAQDNTLSRVHALLVEVAGRRVIADLSSLYGLGLVDSPRSRLLELVDASRIWLGRGTRLTWRERPV